MLRFLFTDYTNDSSSDNRISIYTVRENFSRLFWLFRINSRNRYIIKRASYFSLLKVFRLMLSFRILTNYSLKLYTIPVRQHLHMEQYFKIGRLREFWWRLLPRINWFFTLLTRSLERSPRSSLLIWSDRNLFEWIISLLRRPSR